VPAFSDVYRLLGLGRRGVPARGAFPAASAAGTHFVHELQGSIG